MLTIISVDSVGPPHRRAKQHEMSGRLGGGRHGGGVERPVRGGRDAEAGRDAGERDIREFSQSDYLPPSIRVSEAHFFVDRGFFQSLKRSGEL